MIKLINIKRTDEWIEAMYADPFCKPVEWGYLKLRLPDFEELEFRAGRGATGVACSALRDLAKRETVPETYTRIYH